MPRRVGPNGGPEPTGRCRPEGDTPCARTGIWIWTRIMFGNTCSTTSRTSRTCTHSSYPKSYTPWSSSSWRGYPHPASSRRGARIARFTNTQSLGTTKPTVVAGQKRKRSSIADVSELMQPQKHGRPYRNIDTALILVVLALGKICLYKDGKLPDVISESESTNANNQVKSPPFQQQHQQLRNGHPSSYNQIFPSSFHGLVQTSRFPSSINERSKNYSWSFQPH